MKIITTTYLLRSISNSLWGSSEVSAISSCLMSLSDSLAPLKSTIGLNNYFNLVFFAILDRKKQFNLHLIIPVVICVKFACSFHKNIGEKPEDPGT